MRDALAWYIVVQVAGLAVWPLVSRALAPLEDRGWAASKVAGLLGVAWLVWFVCMLAPVPFTRTTLLVALVGLAAGAWLLELRTGGIEPVLAWLSIQRRLVLSTEVLFLAGFVLFAVLRAHAPAVAATEKPMDMAFLSGFMTAQGLPTQDTWLAGFSVPYYHFGYFVLACLGKITGASPGVAYNLAAATVPALAMVSLASLAWNLARAAGVAASWAVAGSGLATLLGLFCGNLSTLFEYLLSRGIVTVDASVALGINPKHFGNSLP